MKKLYTAIIVLALVITALVAMIQPALAWVDWCSTDLGPMATIAEENNAAAAAKAEALDPAVPMQAVSVDKGGSNPNK